MAICLAHKLQDRGEAKILAIVHDAGIPEGIGAVSVLNHYFGRDDIVLGAYKGDYGKDGNGNWVRGHYVDDLVNNWDSPVWNSDQVRECQKRSELLPLWGLIIYFFDGRSLSRHKHSFFT